MPAIPLSGLRSHLAGPVAAHSLAAFRILFGALLVWDFYRFIAHERLWRYWAEPEFHFSYPGFAWVSVPSEPWLQIAWAGVGLSALLVTLGLFYRAAILVLTVLFSWFFLMDAAEYLNHFYLVILYSLLLCVLPAARFWSLDSVIRRRLFGPQSQTVPRAAVSILRLQTEIMLIFAGLVKLTPDWLAGEPLGMWMRERVAGSWLEPVMAQDAIIILVCWLVIALHVLGAPLLLWSRTRLAVFLVYCIFHIGNAWSFNIGIFPWLTIAATTIFFAPDWPLQLWARLRGHAATQPQTTAAPGKPLPALILCAMALWVGVQIALPLRGIAFASEVRWSGEGHRLSWRMRIYDRSAEGHFIVTDHRSGEVWEVNPDDYLTPRQTDKMMVRADLVHQFAALWQARGHSVSVQAEICKSFNGRPCQAFVDPRVDLTQVTVDTFGSDSWIMPLELPVRGIADNRHAAGM